MNRKQAIEQINNDIERLSIKLDELSCQLSKMRLEDGGYADVSQLYFDASWHFDDNPDNMIIVQLGVN